MRGLAQPLGREQPSSDLNRQWASASISPWHQMRLALAQGLHQVSLDVSSRCWNLVQRGLQEQLVLQERRVLLLGLRERPPQACGYSV